MIFTGVFMPGLDQLSLSGWIRGRRCLGPVGELVDGRLGVADEPVDGLAGAVITEAVLNVVEPGGGVRGEAHAAIAQPARHAHLAVVVLAPGDARCARS
uniref:Uncharacterized protein n=1 Tax=Arundo donax TaxID=35708 RepID=A0A0A8YWM7_ARUDO